MPTLFVGLHLVLAAIVALLGLPFVLDPCGGGGDLCIGWVVGVAALAAAGLLLIALAVWSFGRRASPLLVLDALLAGFGLWVSAQSADIRIPFFALGGQLLLAVGALGAVAAGAAIVRHRIETVVAVVGLVAVAMCAGQPATIAIIAFGLFGLGAGWVLVRRTREAESPTAKPG